MMSSPIELKAQRVNTLAFIAAKPVSLVLIPRTKVKDGSGTRFVDGTPRAAQTFRLLDQSFYNQPNPGLIQTSDGRERRLETILLGPHDAAIELWDYWTDSNGVWEVAQLLPHNGYETRAAVVQP